MAESNQLLHPRSASNDGEFEHESHGVSLNVPSGSQEARPAPVKHMSAPEYQSPLRHHHRTPSRSKGVKETLNARSHYGSSDDDGGASVHRINQYIIKQEIGRGSFGSVHLAEDQYGNEFAVKEFSKSRLRKRAQSNLLRKPNRRPGQLAAAGGGFNSPMHRMSSSEANPLEANNSLDLIKEEIAIMKKLNHNNLVSLFEVLDDPQEDSLYMVLEMCKKGVAMKVGLDERASPYDDETCRCWFRDMILGIEYLHAQGIVHRDIKPDNCLITNEDVLKIVDFGVSEMFEKQSEMTTAKSAGSPAFMPPELCVAKHGQVSGRAADIWSMGVTLFCLRYGHIPFEKGSALELYDSIRLDDVAMETEQDANFKDLMNRLLDKDPQTRITMEEIRNHPWVTKNGTDTLLSSEDNCADIVEPPTETEMNHAITGNMGNVLAVVGAVKRFKHLLHDKRGRFVESILGGQSSRLVAPPHSIDRAQTRSQETHDRRPMDQHIATSGIHRPIDVNDDLERLPQNIDKVAVHEKNPDLVLNTSDSKGRNETEAHYKQRMEARRHHPDVFQSPVSEEIHPVTKRATTFPAAMPHGKGHAHDPLEDQLYLDIGHDPDLEAGGMMLSESPGGVDWNIYEQAYQEEMERILQRRGREPSIYMNRRIDHREDLSSLAYIKDAGRQAARAAVANFDRLYARGYAKGSDMSDAGRVFAKNAADKMYANFPSSSNSTAESRAENLEAWKQWARSGARDGYDASKIAANRASEKLGGLYARHASEGSEWGLSNLVSRAQAKARGTPGDVPINVTAPSTKEPETAIDSQPSNSTSSQAPDLPLLKAETEPARQNRSPSPNPPIRRKPVPSPARKPEEKKDEAADAEPAKSSSPIAIPSLSALKKGGLM